MRIIFGAIARRHRAIESYSDNDLHCNLQQQQQQHQRHLREIKWPLCGAIEFVVVAADTARY